MPVSSAVADVADGVNVAWIPLTVANSVGVIMAGGKVGDGSYATYAIIPRQ